MSQLPSKVNIPIATPSKTKKVYSQSHVTTQTFLTPRPIFAREYIPGRNMSVESNTFVRCNPLPVPILGHCKVHNRAFFVPYRAVMPDWDCFYNNTIFNYGSEAAGGDAIPTFVPVFTNKSFIEAFLDHAGEFCTQISGSPLLNTVDFSLLRVNNSVEYYKLTPKGVNLLTVFESLGYKINWNFNDETPISALPIMCYAKIILDWYYPSAYVGDVYYNSLQRIFDNAEKGREVRLLEFFRVINHITYNPDYFVNAWDQPVGPNNKNVERSISILDVTNDAAYKQIVTNDSSSAITPSFSNTKPSNNTPFVGSNGTNQSTGVGNAVTGVLTQYIDNALKSLTDYTKRHQLAGVRVIDRYLAELGITLSSEILKRSMYLGSQEFDIDFFEVYSHAATENAALGSYAGKGNGFSGDKIFDYQDGKEFGMFIIVNSIIPNIGYYQGQSRETLHISALDFYHPDFDHMAVQPISKREVYVPRDGQVNIAQVGLNTEIFGYGPKFIEYNIPIDRQTGLFLARSQNGLLPFYSLMRDLSFYEQGTLAAMKHNKGFVEGNDYLNYNRIFGVSPNFDGVFEGFIVAHNFNVTNYDCSLPAYDTYDFDDQENPKVKIDVLGSKLN